MVKISKKSLTVFLVFGAVVVLSGLKFFYERSRQDVPKTISIKLPQRAQGNPDAQIKILEFIDFQCPACAKGYKIIHDYLKKNPDKVYVELRYFPLAMHKHGFTSARWGECAARQEKFWPFMDILIARQDEWAAMIDPLPSFTAIAKEAGIDNEQMTACLKDESVDKVIQTDMQEGQMRAVVSTPAYFINHEMVVGTKSLQSKLDELSGLKPEVKGSSR